MTVADHMAKAREFLAAAERVVTHASPLSGEYVVVARGHLDAARTMAELVKAGLATGSGEIVQPQPHPFTEARHER